MLAFFCPGVTPPPPHALSVVLCAARPASGRAVFQPEVLGLQLSCDVRSPLCVVSFFKDPVFLFLSALVVSSSSPCP